MFKRWETLSDIENYRQNTVPATDWPQALRGMFTTPLPDINSSLQSLEFVALDFETTGLDVHSDKILSIGMVDLTLDSIQVATAEELLIQHGAFVKPETARVNGLMPKALDQGESLHAGMSRLMQRISGKVVVAHSCNIESQFLQHYCQEHYGLHRVPVYFVDTLSIEKTLSYAGKSGAHKSFQLDDLRAHYHLPAYSSHSAAIDALACAELLLVQVRKLNLQGKMLRSLLAD